MILDDNTLTLICARDFITQGWCKNHQAVDEDGNEVHPLHENAVKWSAYGALVAGALDRLDNERYRPALTRFLTAIYGSDTANWRDVDEFNNSQDSVDSVLAAFDEAIQQDKGIRAWTPSKQKALLEVLQKMAIDVNGV